METKEAERRRTHVLRGSRNDTHIPHELVTEEEAKDGVVGEERLGNLARVLPARSPVWLEDVA